MVTLVYGIPICAGDQPCLLFWGIYRCVVSSCQKLLLLHCRLSPLCPATAVLFPPARCELPTCEGISTEIAEEYQEAGTCLYAGAYKASMVMSRRVLQRVLKGQGCKERNLKDQIDKAKASRILRPTYHGMAEEVREYGNLGAHPDDDQLKNCTKEDAETLLEFVRVLIEEFFEIPAKVSRMRTKRQAAKNSSAATEKKIGGLAEALLGTNSSESSEGGSETAEL